ncbi:MFS transporter [Rhodococcus pseudokoreensis]|uniref:MFS transporter n=1 Tax=Rhodococcus pseudokoreensis TaxID=2811421 RepID=A0A974ZZ07_9NOCA|nr:MFS transporter [Rhodococcus pseudokoreensis]
MMLSSVVVGLGFAIGGPAMQSIVPAMIRPGEMTAAMSLNTVPITVGRAGGPAMGAAVALSPGAARASARDRGGWSRRRPSRHFGAGIGGATRRRSGSGRMDGVLLRYRCRRRLLAVRSAAPRRGDRVSGQWRIAADRRWSRARGRNGQRPSHVDRIRCVRYRDDPGVHQHYYADPEQITRRASGPIMALWFVGFVGARPFAAGLSGWITDTIGVTAALVGVALPVVVVAYLCRPSYLASS